MGLGDACQAGASPAVNRDRSARCDLAVFTSLYWGEVRLMAGIEFGRTRSALKRRAGARVTESARSRAFGGGDMSDRLRLLGATLAGAVALLLTGCASQQITWGGT